MTIDASLPSQADDPSLVLLPALPAAVLLYLGFFPVDWGWLGWVSLVPLLGLARSRARPRRIYAAAFVVGVAFYAPILQWFRVADVRMYFAWIFLALYCALYFPVVIALVRFLEGRSRLPLVFTLPVVWTALEFFRSTFGSGFSWYLQGHTQHDFLEMIQVSDLTGAYGVSFLVVMVNALLFEALDGRRWFRKLWGTTKVPPRWSRLSLLGQSLAVFAILGLVLAYGVHRVGQTQFTPGPRLALMQTNLPQSARNESASVEQVRQHGYFLSYLAAHFRPDLIVWPETSFPVYWQDTDPERSEDELPAEWQHRHRDTRELARELATRWKTAVLLGLNARIYEADGQERQYNSAVLIDRQGRIAGRYDKIHRVPLGEYVPFREVLPFMDYLQPYDFDYGVAAGRRYSRLVLTTQQGRTYSFGVVICYEDTDPEVARNFGAGRAGTSFLVNISNDGWFRGTSEHEQHLAICRFRAVECRCPVGRSVNMGISAVIDANGRVLKPETSRMPSADPNQWDKTVAEVFDGVVPRVWTVPADAEGLPTSQWPEFKKAPGVLLATLPLDHRPSFYATTGDWLPGTCWLVLAAMLGVAWGRAREPVSRFYSPP